LERVATERYNVLGNAPEPFLRAVSALCEALAADYLDHLAARGLPAQPPGQPLVVVALDGPQSFAAYLGQRQEQAVGGQYDPASNHLVVFDNRGREQAGPGSLRANTIALMHEATHQLTFNTGLLDRAGDIPLAISEGLATLGETRRPDGKQKLGAVNAERAAVFGQALQEGQKWIPLDRLLNEDALFDQPETQQLAYAQSWLLVHDLMQQPPGQAQLRGYMERIRPRRDPAQRLEDARATLGDLETRDQALGKRATRLARGG
jgi:hypothetical protein